MLSFSQFLTKEQVFQILLILPKNMGLTNTPTHTPTTTPDTDNDTPPHTQLIRPFSFTNGTFKNHHDHHKQLRLQPPSHAAVTYRECLKNHAANLGGHALDGCGEFISSPTTDPTSLNCGACGCHRNFHRREVDGYSPFITTIMTPHYLNFHHPRIRSSSSPSPPPPPPPSQMLLALSTATHDDQRVPNHHQIATPVTPMDAKAAKIGNNLSGGRKRFRTKFSQEQKEKMHSFAEKIGWKMPKCDGHTVQNFCNEIGVTRGVLKVWMHNNKNTFGRREISNTIAVTTTTTTTTTNINDSCIKNDEEGDDEEEEEEEKENSGINSNCNIDLDLDHNNSIIVVSSSSS
ncbi:hypothetical protein ACH5RR_030526 [Cinchona calisaya]|uniref:ZF-HD dimerization-type domain-containing protein n=1 Tax=Cinchona calisaya TaxID=153742 RepID=A0ABD2YYC3_9GENT